MDPRGLRAVLLLALAELLAMAVWFSGSAVLPSLTDLWGLGDSGRAWLTMSVQVGFVAGALLSAVLNLADRVPAHRLFSAAALLASAATASIPALARGLGAALVLRFLTGFSLAGVYPVGMKIMATWTRRNRGLAIGLLVGALTLGNASPHLIRSLAQAAGWGRVLYISASLAAAGGLVTLAWVREGPLRAPSPTVRWGHVGLILSDRPLLMANLGYLGHMWELFAMWSWIPLFLAASFEVSGTPPFWAGVAAFAVIGAGAPGCLLAGWLADRMGRTRLISASLLLSGGCALAAGRLFGRNPLLLVPLLLVWGFTVVADSAQYSACVSELCDPRLTGTALTLQTSLGFLLTLVTIRLVPTLVARVGWTWAFSLLAIGPLAGLWAMRALRRMPAARRLAGGRG